MILLQKPVQLFPLMEKLADVPPFVHNPRRNTAEHAFYNAFPAAQSHINNHNVSSAHCTRFLASSV